MTEKEKHLLVLAEKRGFKKWLIEEYAKENVKLYELAIEDNLFEMIYENMGLSYILRIWLIEKHNCDKRHIFKSIKELEKYILSI